MWSEDIEEKYKKLLKEEIEGVREKLEREMLRKLEEETGRLKSKYEKLIQAEKKRRQRFANLGDRLGENSLP